MLNTRQNTLIQPVGSSTVANFAAGYTVTAYSVGARAAAGSSGTTITVAAGHSFRAADKLIVGTDEAKFRVVDSVTATTVVTTASVSVSAGDLIVNLGPDTGTTVPNYDASPMKIYSDPDGTTAITQARVTTSSSGEYTYWHKGDGRFWELVRDSDGDPNDIIPGHSGTNGRISVADMGAALDGSTNDATRVQAAIDAASSLNVSQVYFPPGNCRIADATTVNCATDVDMVGSGWESIITKSATISEPVFGVASVSDITIRDLAMHSNSSSSQDGLIEISGASANITVKNCELYDGYSAVWVKQGTGIRITNNHIYDLSHPVYLGHNTISLGGEVSGVMIEGNNVHTDVASADAIKCIKQCFDITIVNNWLHDCAADGIDMFVSGDRVSITGNTIEGNTINGIDIKSDDSGFPPASWGKNRNCSIVGNIIRSNTVYGIKMTSLSTDDTAYNFVVADNVVMSNGDTGIISDIPYLTISNNVVAGNCTTAGVTASGIVLTTISGSARNATYTTVIGNVVLNNGNATGANNGINLANADNCVVIGNVIDYNANLGFGGESDTGLLISASSENNTVIGNTFGSGLATKFTDSSASTTKLGSQGLTLDAATLRGSLTVTGGDFQVVGGLGNISLIGGASNGHRFQMSRGSANYIEATASGGTLNFRTNASTNVKFGVDTFGAIHEVTTGITASTTQTQGQGALTTTWNEVSTCANANDTVTLPTPAAGRQCIIINNGAQTLQIFPSSGTNLGAGTDTATTIAADRIAIFRAYSATQWRGHSQAMI